MAFLLNKLGLGSQKSDDFPYEVGESIGEVGFWSIHKARRKQGILAAVGGGGGGGGGGAGPGGADKAEELCVLIFDKVRDKQYVSLGQNAFRQMKVLRHPSVIPYVDGKETADKLYVVTPLVSSLHSRLHLYEEHPGALGWGLYCVARAIQFIGDDCNLIHGNLSISNIVVTKSGDWKLAGLELISDPGKANQPLQHFHQLLPDHYKPPELSSTAGSDFWVHLCRSPRSYDAWLLGCLISEVFHGSFHGTSTLKDLTPIPTGLRDEYKELLAPQQRRSYKNLLASRYFKDDYVQAMVFFDQIALRDAYEKDQFFKKLPALVAALPEDVAKYKILPELVQGLDYGTANFRVLGPLMEIASRLQPEEFQSMVGQSVVKWFSTPDASLRMNLLKHLAQFVEVLPAKLINQTLFKSICDGFVSPNRALREATVKSMLVLAPKLSPTNLKTHLLKYFAKLQLDPEPGIRTNTTICLGKIAQHLPKETQKKVLAAAFIRAMKDTFPPSRLAGIVSLSATCEYYNVKEIAAKIVPALSLRTIDQDDDRVRTEAFKALRVFIERLEKKHAEMSGEEYTKEATRPDQERTVLNWASDLAGKATSHVTALAMNRVLGTPMPKAKPPPPKYSSEHVDAVAAQVQREASGSGGGSIGGAGGGGNAGGGSGIGGGNAAGGFNNNSPSWNAQQSQSPPTKQRSEQRSVAQSPSFNKANPFHLTDSPQQQRNKQQQQHSRSPQVVKVGSRKQPIKAAKQKPAVVVGSSTDWDDDSWGDDDNDDDSADYAGPAGVTAKPPVSVATGNSNRGTWDNFGSVALASQQQQQQQTLGQLQQNAAYNSNNGSTAASGWGASAPTPSAPPQAATSPVKPIPEPTFSAFGGGWGDDGWGQTATTATATTSGADWGDLSVLSGIGTTQQNGGGDKAKKKKKKK